MIRYFIRVVSVTAIASCSFFVLAVKADSLLRLGLFIVDASPPVGSPMAYDRCDAIGMPLSARGIVLIGSGEPIVLCAVDWIGISNGGYERWRETIARAVKTSPERVSVHSLHQHDALRCNFNAQRLLAERGLGRAMFDVAFARKTIENVAAAAKEAVDSASAVTHVGLGHAKVEKVASNRRILGPDSKVRVMRYAACADPEVRAEPEGTIDPYVKSISFRNEDEPVVVLTYYATHPQSCYRTGVAHADFPGTARLLRQSTLNGFTHVHFNGAGGNIGAGKYDDGCNHCGKYHHHGPAEGHRIAHCNDPTSPYYTAGYNLAYAGKLPDHGSSRIFYRSVN